jgi:hypothetical protein
LNVKLNSTRDRRDLYQGTEQLGII